MAAMRHEDELSGNRQVILILRLMLDRQNHVHRGEIIDVHGVCHGRFVNLPGLVDSVTRWLERQRTHPGSHDDRAS